MQRAKQDRTVPLAPVVLKDRGEADPAGPSCGSLSVDSSSGARASPLFCRMHPSGHWPVPRLSPWKRAGPSLALLPPRARQRMRLLYPMRGLQFPRSRHVKADTLLRPRPCYRSPLAFHPQIPAHKWRPFWTVLSLGEERSRSVGRLPVSWVLSAVPEFRWPRAEQTRRRRRSGGLRMLL